MNEFMEQAELPSRVAVIDVHVNERRMRVRQSDTSDFSQRDLSLPAHADSQLLD